MNKNQLQQGDINIEKIDEDFFNKIKEKKELKNDGKFVVAHGESGHKHQLEGQFESYEYFDEYLGENCLLMKMLKDSCLKHEEHHHLKLDANNFYRFSKVNEYDPFLKYEKKVQD